MLKTEFTCGIAFILYFSFNICERERVSPKATNHRVQAPTEEPLGVGLELLR